MVRYRPVVRRGAQSDTSTRAGTAGETTENPGSATKDTEPVRRKPFAAPATGEPSVTAGERRHRRTGGAEGPGRWPGTVSTAGADSAPTARVAPHRITSAPAAVTPLTATTVVVKTIAETGLAQQLAGPASNSAPVIESSSVTTGSTTASRTAPAARRVVTAVSRLLVAAGLTPSFDAGTGDVPPAPMALAIGLLHFVRRELESSLAEGISTINGVSSWSLVATEPSGLFGLTTAAAATIVTPQPGDTASTQYGEIGKWMLKSSGQVADWGGSKYQGRSLVEPVNVIIIDEYSSSPEESARRVNAALSRSGFPASAPHSSGYRGLIDGKVYGQQPSGLLQAYDDHGSPNSHGRLFGPAPLPDGSGYVWTGAFSTQNALHGYHSFDQAQQALADRLVASGAAVRLDDVDLDNAVDTATQTTGDHNGKAIVLRLNPSLPNTDPVITVSGAQRVSTWTGTVGGKVTATDAEKDKISYAATVPPEKGTVKISSTGAYTFTPTAAARHAAAASTASPADKEATITITVTDAYGGVSTETVTVPVVPKNSAPTAKAKVDKPDPVGGTVTGRIDVTDADGDAPTYTVVTQPAKGAVTVNPDGTFTYTPTAAARDAARLSRTKVVDKFTVRVDDGYGGARTVTVPVTVAPSNSAPGSATPEVGSPSSTGVVKGSVIATDPDNDSLTYSGSTRTAKGRVTVSRNGTFTYTPTTAARKKAGSDTATAADKTDTFVIYVTDKYGAVIPVEVEVPINPLPSLL
ncbi:Ig-like domain-containing protein [Mycolicibacterium hassiacum]|uniref:Ig-like domain-containing protein n=1 Tax=Mycolicibacterium hassiacum TaxID=46351 RepID=UPI0003610B5C|nr:Ig-like domain-containing protein [Mycolicibacterium hassiacum]